MAHKRHRLASPPDAHKRSRSGPSSHVFLGTPLPTQGLDDGAFVPQWKQTVTDERGRRRLHGAFTGGFSAGYFNTVGSRQGWTPAAFVSSRTNRTKDQHHGQAQRAEDFMDEEDLAAAAESRQLETTRVFAGIHSVSETGDNGFFAMFAPQEETMGVKLAQKMGWRRDQGIGCKIRRGARLGIGVDGPDGSSSHWFAPEDARVMHVPAEDTRRKGLGYLTEARLVAIEEKKESSSSFNLPCLDTWKKPFITRPPAAKQSSFGVGVLNDTGSDDEDPYDLAPKITLNKSLSKDKKTKKPSKFAKKGLGEKHVFVSKKVPSTAPVALAKVSIDGHPPLRGFTLSASPADLTLKRAYPPPEIPPGWKSSKATTSDSNAAQHQSVVDAAKASTLDVKGRSAMLGETALPGKSVFDFISKEARDRLAAISGKAHLPQGRGEKAPGGHLPAKSAQIKDLWSLVPPLEKTIAAAALAKGATGWMPYAEDEKKRIRYVGFLELRAGLREDLPERVDGVSVSDWTKELQEFAHAAQVFKPTTGIMASRFTSATSSSLAGSNTITHSADPLAPTTAKPEDPAEQAARLGMYGPMTRSTFSFYPSRLLCKRFNVKPPPDVFPDASVNAHADTKPQTQEAVSKSAMDKMMHEILTHNPSVIQRHASMHPAPAAAQKGSADDDMGQKVGAKVEDHATVDVETNEAVSGGRAADEVFKAIFGDGEDEDED